MAEKSGLGNGDVQSYLEGIERTVEVNRGLDRTTYSLVRRD